LLYIEFVADWEACSMAQFYEKGDGRAPAIPYPALAQLLFTDNPDDGKQRLVPFFGAGASVGAKPPAQEPVVLYPDEVKCKELIGALKFSPMAARFMELAIQLAVRIRASEEAARGGQSRPTPFESACAAQFPPSASELAAALAQKAQYDGFERPRRRIQPLLALGDEELVQLLTWIAELTEIGPSVPPLLSVASYYESTDPIALWQDLKKIFSNKRTPTPAHLLVARAAETHLKQEEAFTDYLIVTTNYDCLTEIALDSVNVACCVLTVTSPDRPVQVRFGPRMQEYLGYKDARFDSLKREHSGKYPKDFTLDLRKPVVIVFKLHGCLSPDNADSESIVVSDEDYIRYLMQMHDGAMIPAEVSKSLGAPGFLFLGYSFADWNVRAIYKSVIRKRTSSPGRQPRDYAVVRDFSHYESALCQTDIHMLVTDLATFAAQMMSAAPESVRDRALQEVH
jgi:hypothetical protein